MKNSSLKNGIITGLVAFLTIGLLSIGYATLSSGLSLSDKVGTGSGLSSSSWNKIVDSILELDGKVSKTTYVEGTIGTSSPITLPYSTSTYTQNSITLPPGKWQITMIAPVHGNNFGSGGNWHAYHVHHELSSTQPTFTAFQAHSYWAEGSPYANSPVVQIVDISTPTTLYWFTWFNGGNAVSTDTATYYYAYPSTLEKPYFYARLLQ